MPEYVATCLECCRIIVRKRRGRPRLICQRRECQRRRCNRLRRAYMGKP